MLETPRKIEKYCVSYTRWSHRGQEYYTHQEFFDGAHALDKAREFYVSAKKYDNDATLSKVN